MIQCVITPASGKRLIARGVLCHEAVTSALREGTIVIVAGTTNGYVAEEILREIGQLDGFDRHRFFRGVTMPPHVATTDTGRLPDESEFLGDVVIKKGEWLRRKTLFDVLEDLKEGDVILKGANAFNLQTKQAGILIGHPKGGTIVAALQAVVGRRVRLLLPVGLEKRISDKLDDIAKLLNTPLAKGPRFLPVSGEVLTEIEALKLLVEVEVCLVAGGGVCSAEGAVRLAVWGKDESLAAEILASVANEPPFVL